MKRLFAVTFAAVTLVGCRSSGQATDPFFGRTTIEPPHTGSVLGQSEPYYQPSNLAGTRAHCAATADTRSPAELGSTACHCEFGNARTQSRSEHPLRHPGGKSQSSGQSQQHPAVPEL